MTEEDRFIRYVRQTLRDADAPPPAPRDEMWARIQAQRTATRAEPVVDIATRRRVPVWLRYGSALAAMLVLGIGLGRFSMRESAPDAGPSTTAAVPTQEDASSSPYRLAAVQHLQKTETLLTSLAASGNEDGAGEMRQWARDLLTDTRLLLSSPAAEDPGTRRLLEDLELLLSQVAAIPSARAQQEVELIREGMNQSDVLLRLRAATAGPVLVGT